VTWEQRLDRLEDMVQSVLQRLAELQAPRSGPPAPGSRQEAEEGVRAAALSLRLLGARF
jgi:hypothetical protein